jgi:hypothetical protein
MIRKTSLDAYRSLNLHKSQIEVLWWMSEHMAERALTRREIATESRIPINSICGRINELLHDFDPSPIEELPAKNGAHPIRLVFPWPPTQSREVMPNAEVARSRLSVNDSPAGRLHVHHAVTGAAHPQNAVEKDVQTSTPDCCGSVVARSERSSSRVVASDPREEGVTPYVPGRWSMTLDQAKNLQRPPWVGKIPEEFAVEAADVMAKGVHWRF